MRVCILQHIACEPAGLYGQLLRRRGITSHAIELNTGQPLPRLADYDALIVMGGPMGVHDEQRHPWLRDEKSLLAAALAADTPVLGVCLGAQLLADVGGGVVRRALDAEIGIGQVRVTEHAAGDPVFGQLPRAFEVFQWHSDTFEMPLNDVLAWSDKYPQAFRIGRSYGLQFHLEVGPEFVDEWAEVPEYAEALEALPGAPTITEMRRQLEVASDQMGRIAESVFDSWLDLVAGAHPSVAPVHPPEQEVHR